MKKFSNILWGLVFVLLGVVIFLKTFNILDVNIFFKGWWTLFIIVPSFIGIFKNEEKTWNITMLIIGVLLLLGSRGIVTMGNVVKCIVPVILVTIGISIIFKDKLNKKVDVKIKEINDKNKSNEQNEIYSAFSGQKLDYTNQEFEGLKLNAIFGGIDLNLKEAKVSKDVVVDASAVFGGINIIAPPNVNVKVESNSIFGGVSNKTACKDGAHTIYVKAFCMFGGVDIK